MKKSKKQIARIVSISTGLLGVIAASEISTIIESYRQAKTVSQVNNAKRQADALIKQLLASQSNQDSQKSQPDNSTQPQMSSDALNSLLSQIQSTQQDVKTQNVPQQVADQKQAGLDDMQTLLKSLQDQGVNIDYNQLAQALQNNQAPATSNTPAVNLNDDPQPAIATRTETQDDAPWDVVTTTFDLSKRILEQTAQSTSKLYNQIFESTQYTDVKAITDATIKSAASSISRVVNITDPTLDPMRDVITPDRLNTALESVGKDKDAKITKIDKVYATNDDRGTIYVVEFDYKGTKITLPIAINYVNSHNELFLQTLTDADIIIDPKKLSGSAPAIANKDDFSTTIAGVNIINVSFANANISSKDLSYSVDVKIGSAVRTITKNASYANPFIDSEFANLPKDIFSYLQVSTAAPLTVDKIKSIINPNIAKVAAISNIVDKHAQGQYITPEHMFQVDANPINLTTNISIFEKALIGSFMVKLGTFINDNGNAALSIQYSPEAKQVISDKSKLNAPMQIMQLLIAAIYQNSAETTSANIDGISTIMDKYLIGGTDKRSVIEALRTTIEDIKTQALSNHLAAAAATGTNPSPATTSGAATGANPSPATTSSAQPQAAQNNSIIKDALQISFDGQQNLNLGGKTIESIYSIYPFAQTQRGMGGFTSQISDEFKQNYSHQREYTADLTLNGVTKNINLILLTATTDFANRLANDVVPAKVIVKPDYLSNANPKANPPVVGSITPPATLDIKQFDLDQSIKTDFHITNVVYLSKPTVNDIGNMEIYQDRFPYYQCRLLV